MCLRAAVSLAHVVSAPIRPADGPVYYRAASPGRETISGPADRHALHRLRHREPDHVVAIKTIGGSRLNRSQTAHPA